jgi:cation diffusion facilitator family transporter
MNDKSNAYLIKISLISSITVSIVILLLKVYALIVTSSVSILASLIDSGLDFSVSIMNYIAVKYALEPPDHNHRFGHDKIQDMAIFLQSIFFFGSGVFAIIAAIRHYIYQHEIESAPIAIFIMLISIMITLILLLFQTYVIKKTSSNLIKAEKLHYLTDLCTNFVVIIGVYFGKDYPIIDVILGGLIAFYIIYGSYQLLKSSIKNLMDEEFDDEEKARIVGIISNFKEVKGLHDLKTRKAGDRSFIQFHLELDGDMLLKESHEIAEKIMYAIKNIFTNAEIIIHQDPEGVEEHVQYRESL